MKSQKEMQQEFIYVKIRCSLMPLHTHSNRVDRGNNADLLNNSRGSCRARNTIFIFLGDGDEIEVGGGQRDPTRAESRLERCSIISGQ
jgi:hypothetical protein